MNWFIAKLVYRIVCGHGNHSPQFDEQLRLIYAEDELHAFHKARLLGDGDRINEEGETAVNVQWRFIDVVELHALECTTDGVEINSLIKEEPDAEMYIRNTRKRASQLLQYSLHQFTGINNMAFGT